MEEEILDDAVVINTEEVVEPIEPKDGQEDTVALQEKLDAAEKAKSQILARAKKAEEELKTLKAKPQDNNQSSNPQLSEELKLIAKGLSDEEIEQAKVIAKGKDISLPEAIKDSLFLTYQADLKEKERKEKAKLGASKGSSETQEEVTGLQSGSSREEHMKAFNKIVGKK
jgi:hypothetical protein